MTVYYKATRPDGTDFRTGTVAYRVGETVTHPNPHTRDASGYLSVATVATDCTGMRWPCRLFEVEATETWTARDFPSKRCTHSLRVVREVDAHLALGPQGREVAALIARAGRLTAAEARALNAARDAAWAARGAAWDAAWDAAWATWAAARDAAWAARGATWAAARDAAWAARGAAWDATWDAARGAARDATWALVVRDLIGGTFIQAHYDALTRPWRTVVGPIHPDDEEGER